MGVTNYVVQPQDWDERGKGVKTDRIDALALCLRLDRYTRGNLKAFSIVRVPTEDEERQRAFTRQRQQIVRERQRLQSMGRSLLASHGIHVTGKWWKGKTWSAIRAEAPEWVIEHLEVFSRRIQPMEAQANKMTEAIQEEGLQNQARIPRGVGPLTFEVLRREVGDWARFTNRRQVSSYTGLCPRESSRGAEARWTERSGARRVPERAERGHQFSSGGKRKAGSVSKSGNPRVRAMLVEMVWRMIRWQPGYHALQKWMHVLGDASRSPATRKKAIVAVARQLAVDLWRLFTGQTTAEKLGLIYLPEADADAA
jgi:transposase